MSTSKQEANYSKPQQTKGILSYAKESKHEIVEFFDDTISGTRIDRPGLLQMRAFILKRKTEGNPIKHIYVYHIDRWARDILPQLTLDGQFQDLGCTMHYVIGRFADDDDGEMMKQFSGIISGRERKAILRRTTMGKIGRAENGQVIISCSAPYGYTYVSEFRKGRLEIRDKEAAVVKLIHKWYNFGLDDNEIEPGYEPHHPLAMRAIGRMLMVKGIPTRADTDGHQSHVAKFAEWRITSVQNILTSRVYIGEWAFGKSGTTVKTPIIVKVPEIISVELHEASQERIKHNNMYNPRNVRNHYLLRSRIRCQCGSSMCGHAKNIKAKPCLYYVCGSQSLLRSYENTCKALNCRADYVEEIVRATVVAAIQKRDRLVKGIRELNQKDRIANDAYQAKIANYQTRINYWNQQSDNLLDQAIAKVFTPAQIERKNKEYVAEREKVEHERDAEEQVASKVISEKTLKDFEQICAGISKGIETGTYEDWQEYLSLLDLQVIVDLDKTVHVSIAIEKVRANISVDGEVVI